MAANPEIAERGSRANQLSQSAQLRPIAHLQTDYQHPQFNWLDTAGFHGQNSFAKLANVRPSSSPQQLTKRTHRRCLCFRTMEFMIRTKSQTYYRCENGDSIFQLTTQLFIEIKRHRSNDLCKHTTTKSISILVEHFRGMIINHIQRGMSHDHFTHTFIYVHYYYKSIYACDDIARKNIALHSSVCKHVVFVCSLLMMLLVPACKWSGLKCDCDTFGERYASVIKRKHVWIVTRCPIKPTHIGQ